MLAYSIGFLDRVALYKMVPNYKHKFLIRFSCFIKCFHLPCSQYIVAMENVCDLVQIHQQPIQIFFKSYLKVLAYHRNWLLV